MQGGKGPSSLMTAPSAVSITHLSKLKIKLCKVVLVVSWEEGHKQEMHTSSCHSQGIVPV